jgi:hypothetical protein
MADNGAITAEIQTEEIEKEPKLPRYEFRVLEGTQYCNQSCRMAGHNCPCNAVNSLVHKKVMEAEQGVNIAKKHLKGVTVAQSVIHGDCSNTEVEIERRGSMSIGMILQEDTPAAPTGQVPEASTMEVAPEPMPV